MQSDDEIRYPSLKQAERLHKRVLEMTEENSGYLSKTNLEYVLDAIKDIGEKFARKQALIKKTAFLLHNVVSLHPFVNGNKRTAYELARLFVQLNGLDIKAEGEDVYQLLLRVAAGKTSVKEVEKWIATNLTESCG